MEIKRGDIFYVSTSQSVGSEQYSGRPAIIVSNDKNNCYSNVVEVVYLTTSPHKQSLPTHVNIHSAPRESIALCEQVTTVAIERLLDKCGHLSNQEMVNVDISIMISLDLTTPASLSNISEAEKLQKAKEMQQKEEISDLQHKNVQLNAKYELLQKMYNDLLHQLINRNSVTEGTLSM